MVDELTKTFDNPLNLLKWFNTKSSSLHIYSEKQLDLITNDEWNLQQDILSDFYPNRTLPSIFCETDTSGNITSYYVYGLGLISKIEGNNAYFYQYDGLGSTIAITDKNGNIKNKYSYDDFGNIATNSTETISNPFKYVGKFGIITDTPDLLYMRARYYIPSLGRFISKDPIGFIDGLNLYTYTGNNPINSIDPIGEQSVTEVISLTAILIATVSALTLLYLNKDSQPLRYEIRVETRPWLFERPKPRPDPCLLICIQCYAPCKGLPWYRRALSCVICHTVCLASLLLPR